MRGSIIQKLWHMGGKVAILMLLEGINSHAMELVIKEEPIEDQILKNMVYSIDKSQLFFYPFVTDEQEFEELKNNSYYYPFDFDTTYETLLNEPLMFKTAERTRFLEVAKRSAPKNSFFDSDLLWSEQQEFLKSMNLEKLAYFFPLVIGKDMEGNTFSYGQYKSYILHSKEFKSNNQTIPCLEGSNQVNDSFHFALLCEPKTIRRHHYQLYFYSLYDPSRENFYVLWIEACNPKGTFATRVVKCKEIITHFMNKYVSYVTRVRRCQEIVDYLIVMFRDLDQDLMHVKDKNTVQEILNKALENLDVLATKNEEKDADLLEKFMHDLTRDLSKVKLGATLNSKFDPLVLYKNQKFIVLIEPKKVIAIQEVLNQALKNIDMISEINEESDSDNLEVFMGSLTKNLSLMLGDKSLNPKFSFLEIYKTHGLDQITIRRDQKYYYDVCISNIIKNIQKERKSMNLLRNRKEILVIHPEIFLQIPMEFALEVHETSSLIRKSKNNILINNDGSNLSNSSGINMKINDDKGEVTPKSQMLLGSPLEVHETAVLINKIDSNIINSNENNTLSNSSGLIIKINDSKGDVNPRAFLQEDQSPKQDRRPRSLSDYVARAAKYKPKFKVEPLKLPEIKAPNNRHSLSTPNSPTGPLIEYQTGTTPKSAPNSLRRVSDSRVTISDGEPTRIEMSLESVKGKIDDTSTSEEYHETLKDLKILEEQNKFLEKQQELVEKQRKSVAVQREKLVQKLKALESPMGSMNLTPEIPMGPTTITPRSAPLLRNSGSRDPSPRRTKRRDILRSSTSPSESSPNTLWDNRTKSPEQQQYTSSDSSILVRSNSREKSKSISPRSSPRDKIIISRDKTSPRGKGTNVSPRDKSTSVSPRSKSNNVSPRDRSTSVSPRDKSADVSPRDKGISVSPRDKSNDVSPREKIIISKDQSVNPGEKSISSSKDDKLEGV